MEIEILFILTLYFAWWKVLFHLPQEINQLLQSCYCNNVSKEKWHFVLIHQLARKSNGLHNKEL